MAACVLIRPHMHTQSPASPAPAHRKNHQHRHQHPRQSDQRRASPGCDRDYAQRCHAYVANNVSATVTPIGTATNTPGPAIQVGKNPEAVAIAPQTQVRSGRRAGS